eukprot:308066_1
MSVYLALFQIWLHAVPSRHILSKDYNGWIAPLSPLLPRKDYDVAVASYNHTIFLFGGLNNNNQLTLFDTITKNITDVGQDAFSYNVYGSSQFYTQINYTFYWIDGDSGSKIIAHDFVQKTYESITIIPNNVGHYGCLASNADMLFVAGGKFASVSIATFQIYNISSNIWISGDSMQQPRRDFCCIVHPITNSLYAIGGWVDGSALASVEKILIDSIVNQHWQYIENLTYRSEWTRAIVHKEYILVIGANYYFQNTEQYISLIQKINVINDQISSGGYLHYALSDTAAIIVDSRIYAFGGFNGESLNTWQYLDLTHTNDPTNTPTNSPVYNVKGNLVGNTMTTPIYIYILAITAPLLLLIVIALYLMCRKRKKNQKDKDETNEYLMMETEFLQVNAK